MLEKIKATLGENVTAVGIIILGAILVLAKHEEAGKAVITGGCVHLK